MAHLINCYSLCEPSTVQDVSLAKPNFIVDYDVIFNFSVRRYRIRDKFNKIMNKFINDS